MEQAFNWTISQLERKSDNGFVMNIHWRYSLTEDKHTAETYSAQSFTQESEDFIPFNDITEADVIAWLEASLDVEQLQESLRSQIEILKNSPVIKGLPWANKVEPTPSEEITE